MNLTQDQFAKLFPKIADPQDGLALSRAMEHYRIDTTDRMAMFLATIGHESNGLTSLVESLNYSVQALLQSFSRSRITEDDARKFGRDDHQSANQPEIGKRIYGGDWGVKNLGNVKGSDDGWTFRGRGAIQITGRHNYEDMGRELEMPDLLDNPEKLGELPGACWSAAAWWAVNGCNQLADQKDFTAVTKRVNGGTNGMEDREEWLDRAYAVLDGEA